MADEAPADAPRHGSNSDTATGTESGANDAPDAPRTAAQNTPRNTRQPAHLTPWAPGQSGNPGGRPKSVLNVARLARTHTREAIATLAKIMSDRKASPSARVAAASVILDRGHGKAAQVVDLRSDDSTPLARVSAEALIGLLNALRADAPVGSPAIDVTPVGSGAEGQRALEGERESPAAQGATGPEGCEVRQSAGKSERSTAHAVADVPGSR